MTAPVQTRPSCPHCGSAHAEMQGNRDNYEDGKEPGRYRKIVSVISQYKCPDCGKRFETNRPAKLID